MDNKELKINIQMIQPKTTLSNYYYFFNDNIVFDIKNYNDEDKCGKHKVTYLTEGKKVEKGHNYIDLHGDFQKAETEGTYQVSTGKLDEAECAKVFPHFNVNYQDSEGNQYTVYYWLQNLIKDGDKLQDGRFVMNETHGGNYLTVFEKSIDETIAEYAKSGLTVEQIMRKMPKYCFSAITAEDEKTTFEINKTHIYKDGKKIEVSYVNVTGLSSRNADYVMGIVYNAIDEQTKDFANEKLKVHGKKLDENATLISKNNVVNINQQEETSQESH